MVRRVRLNNFWLTLAVGTKMFVDRMVPVSIEPGPVEQTRVPTDVLVENGDGFDKIPSRMVFHVQARHETEQIRLSPTELGFDPQGSRTSSGQLSKVRQM